MRQWPEEISSKQGTVSGLSSEATASSAPPFMRTAASPAFPSRCRHGAPGTKGLFLDLRDPDFAALERTRYGFAFLCAAVTDMRACQEDPALTRQVNVANTIELMRRLADRGTHLVFLSSSQVFDGETANPTEDAATCPKNEYGAQKLAVEQAIERHELPAAILRPTKILASHPVGVFKAWFEALGKGQAIQAATNMALSPVMVDDVARAAALLAAGRHRGIWHLGASDEMTYFEAARLMAAMQHAAADAGEGRGADRCPGAGDLPAPPYDAVEPEDRARRWTCP